MTDEALLTEFIGLLPRSRAATRRVQAQDSLEALYAAFPEGTPRFPRLYEQLILSWEWKGPEAFSVDLTIGVSGYRYPLDYTLVGNVAGKTPFAPLLGEMQRDKGLWNALIPACFIPFGRGGVQSYDPVCFDLNRRDGNDCSIVGIDHEEILCFDRIKIAVELAPSFRELMSRTL